MKKTLSIIFAAFMSCFSFAQNGVSPGVICSYYGEPLSLPLAVVNSSEDAQRAIAAITDVVGLEGKFEVKQANIPNAAAIIYNSKRYILYNPAFISRINNAAGDKWAAIAILAHEIGHHLDGHTLDRSGSHPETELEADEFSGFVLRKMGATLEQAQSALNIVATERATATHPAKANRLLSIDNGWEKADAQIDGRKFIAKNNTPTAENDETYARSAANVSYTLKPGYVNLKVFFSGDPDGKYFITTQNQLVAVKGEKIIVLGTLMRQQSEAFPFSVQLSETGSFFISREGNVLNAKGVTIGYVKAG